MKAVQEEEAMYIKAQSQQPIWCLESIGHGQGSQKGLANQFEDPVEQC